MLSSLLLSSILFSFCHWKTSLRSNLFDEPCYFCKNELLLIAETFVDWYICINNHISRESFKIVINWIIVIYYFLTRKSILKHICMSTVVITRLMQFTCSLVYVWLKYTFYYCLFGDIIFVQWMNYSVVRIGLFTLPKR